MNVNLKQNKTLKILSFIQEKKFGLIKPNLYKDKKRDKLNKIHKNCKFCEINDNTQHK